MVGLGDLSGGAFGSKLYLYAEEIITAMIAKRLALPVKWIEQRTENYLATTHTNGESSHGDDQAH